MIRHEFGVFGPLESYAPGFRLELSRQGYTSHSAACQLHLMAHVSRWLAAEGLEATGLTAAGVEAFLAARRAAGYAQWCSVKALVPLLGYSGRRPRRSPTISRCSSRSTTTPPSTGSTSGPPTPSSRPSPRSDTARRSPADRLTLDSSYERTSYVRLCRSTLR